MASLSHAGAPDVEASNVEERGKGGGMGSSTDYESSDEEWRSPFIDAETGESCFDEETGTFPYGTLSKTASKISSPDGVTRRFLEMLRYSDKDFPCEVPSLFIDIGCGRGQVVNRVASELKCKCVGIDISQNVLGIAEAEARKLGVESFLSFDICDFREFHTKIPADTAPSEVLCYMYLIPKMICNRDF
eukprot:g5326.t1